MKKNYEEPQLQMLSYSMEAVLTESNELPEVPGGSNGGNS